MSYGRTCDPTGIRTPVSWLRTRCPGPLDDGAVSPSSGRCPPSGECPPPGSNRQLSGFNRTLCQPELGGQVACDLVDLAGARTRRPPPRRGGALPTAPQAHGRAPPSRTGCLLLPGQAGYRLPRARTPARAPRAGSHAVRCGVLKTPVPPAAAGGQSRGDRIRTCGARVWSPLLWPG